MSAAFLKDPSDPTWKDDPGVLAWHAFMDKYNKGAAKGTSPCSVPALGK